MSSFRIIELTQSADGSLNESGTRFEWDVETHTLPEQPWSFGGELRTTRTDYRGSDEPAEQVLGPNFTPFTLQGAWKDRWAGDGFANRTWKAFEAMCWRGNLCRVQFEDVSFVGLIKNWNFPYRRKSDVGYTFTVSPHTRDGKKNERNVLGPEQLEPPDSFVARAAKVVEGAQEIQAAAPSAYMEGTLHADAGAIVSDWAGRIDSINAVVATRVLAPNGSGPNSIARLAQGFQGLAASAGQMRETLLVSSAFDDLPYQTPVLSALFEAWSRGLKSSARQLAVISYLAALELQRRIDPLAVALYRPSRGESLYAISSRFYSTPHRWRDIAERNNLEALTLSGTELLVIPNVS